MPALMQEVAQGPNKFEDETEVVAEGAPGERTEEGEPDEGVPEEMPVVRP